MPLVVNEHGELYDPADFEPPKHLTLKGCNVGQIRADMVREARSKPRPPKRRGNVGDTARCDWCGREFTLRRTTQRYCSRECKGAGDAADKRRMKRRGK